MPFFYLTKSNFAIFCLMRNEIHYKREQRPKARDMFSGVTGGMIFSQEELQSWVTKNMPTLLRQGLLFNRAVYNEMFLALDASRDDLVAIIPADADNAEDLIHQFFI